MTRNALTALLACMVAVGCGRRPEPVAPPEPAPRPPRPPAVRPARPLGPLDERASFAFDAVPLPEVIGRLGRDHGVRLALSRSVPFDRWARHTVTVRMADVSRRAFLDWLIRPLGAVYGVEGHGAVWVARDDELLATEALVLRSYSVPTHVRARRPVQGRLSFAREQRVILDTLEAGLRYLLDRRKGCRLAFHGEQDILVARLPARGHARLAELLDAMRYGTGPPELPSPARHELQARLRVQVACEGRPMALASLLARVGEQARLNFGWDAQRLGAPVVSIPKGKHAVDDILRAVLAQTSLARYDLEPGHGIWLYPKGQDKNARPSSATPWDRAVVRAHDVRPLLARSRRETILDELHKRVDPGQWKQGLPALAIFSPTARLLVVHDPAGQQRVATAVQEMLASALTAPRPGQER